MEIRKKKKWRCTLIGTCKHVDIGPLSSGPRTTMSSCFPSHKFLSAYHRFPFYSSSHFFFLFSSSSSSLNWISSLFSPRLVLFFPLFPLLEEFSKRSPLFALSFPILSSDRRRLLVPTTFPFFAPSPHHPFSVR